MSRGRPLTKEQIALVRRLFPDHTKREIAERAGVGASTVDRIQAMFHLRKSPEHLHAMGVRAGKASYIARGGDSSACYTPEAKAKRLATYKKRYALEDMRVRWGLTQQTKMRLKHGTKHYHDQVYYLRKMGYIIDERNKVAYYTETTHRATRLESAPRGRKVGSMLSHFDFKPYDGKMDL